MKTTLTDIVSVLTDNDNYLIVIHEKADGDALGSSTALALFLNKLGKKCAILSPSKISERLLFIKSQTVTYFETAEHFNNSGYKYNYVLTVDVASNELISSVLPCFNNTVNTVIDHHRVNNIQAPVKYIDEYSSATGEIVYSIINQYEKISKTKVIDDAIASALFTSISSDTGCFKYSNTTSKTHKIASELLKLDIKADEINKQLFDTKTKSQICAEKLGYKNLKMLCDDKLAIIVITKNEMKKHKITEDDTETLSQQARMITGVQIGVLMREKTYPDGKVGFKFSVRSNIDSDMSDLCSKFGGGGHKKAAGCTIFNNKNKAIKAFIDEAKKHLV